MVTAEASTDAFEIDVAPFPKRILAHAGVFMTNSQRGHTNKPMALTIWIGNPQWTTGQAQARTGLQAVEVISKLLTSQHQ